MTRAARLRAVITTGALLCALAACGSSTDAATATTKADARASTTAADAPVKFVADVWADNWFALYVNGELVGEDSVPITTQRSFNKERISFTSTYPLTIAVLAKDYIEDTSGLEYIGTPQQQIGDGGLIAQIRDERTGRLVAVTNGDWRTLVVQRSPLDPSCVRSADPIAECQQATTPTPADWATPSFDDASWPKVTEYTAEQVGGHGDYSLVTWDPSASLIWGSDLKVDNVLLLRAPAVEAP